MTFYICLAFVIFEITYSFPSSVANSAEENKTSPPVREEIPTEELEVFRQYAFDQGQWLVGLAKQELRLLSKLTGTTIGGDLLSGEGSSLGAVDSLGGLPLGSQSEIDALENHTNSFFASYVDLPQPQPGLSQPTNGINTGTVPGSFSPSITDPTDEELLLSPIVATADSNNSANPSAPSAGSVGTNNPSDGPLESQNSPPLPQFNPLAGSSNNQLPTVPGSVTNNQVMDQNPLDPLIYPVQYYNPNALQSGDTSTQTNPQNGGFNPLAQLPEKYPDNFQGW